MLSMPSEAKHARFVSRNYQSPFANEMIRESDVKKTKNIEDGANDENNGGDYVYTRAKTQLGPSKFASILGFSSFETASQLSLKLKDGYWSSPNSSALQHGIKLEKQALKWYTRLMKTNVKKGYWINRLPVNGKTRICGIADGLIGNDGGVEVKCHYSGKMCRDVPPWYLPQVLGYLFLYDRKWWDFMSCIFDQNGKLIQCCITRVYRQDHQNRWYKWWKTIRMFCINQWKKKLQRSNEFEKNSAKASKKPERKCHSRRDVEESQNQSKVLEKT